ncbi:MULTISPECIES: DUF6445 family protein [Shewanella]|uniref:2OG-Fe(II) oxygenase n=1 Tax=Shewanella japonica TaxID=93973 RepID=A0ABN4YK94_9GAMM|nr:MULTISPECIES: DUF6445 family protein [Shewanella]ARD23968.1 hypothetical protein SJ2017_3727 [Shewanella japonica]KPZ72296.1 hypothetical protein AN944_01074 [Shewanella sp. P1-14-1]MBQ4889344.1 hypothetical protein [Shewanella sp. MMG014]OBT08105.1 hypothetical protein A9267_10290 [Shewanella sp. UCD-FRSSP16_17]
MHPIYSDELNLPDAPFDAPKLNYEKPEENKNFWIIDNFFSEKQATEIANRCFMKSKWKLGKPYTSELWPGMRSKNALKKKELLQVENWIKETLKVDKLWVAESNSVVVDTNTAILVGADEGAARPHVDNRQLCRYGAVLFLSKNPKPHSGTSFYRLKYANEAAGGNLVQKPYNNLVDALNTDSLPPSAWYEDEAIENKFNRLILFKGNMVHSASSYFGKEKREKRLAITFFYMTED